VATPSGLIEENIDLQPHYITPPNDDDGDMMSMVILAINK
jgi:hypothetical protein